MENADDRRMFSKIGSIVTNPLLLASAAQSQANCQKTEIGHKRSMCIAEHKQSNEDGAQGIGQVALQQNWGQ